MFAGWLGENREGGGSLSWGSFVLTVCSVEGWVLLRLSCCHISSEKYKPRAWGGVAAKAGKGLGMVISCFRVQRLREMKEH